MKNFKGYHQTDQRRGERVPASVQDRNCLRTDITQIKNGIDCYSDLLRDAMQALALIQQQIRTYERRNQQIPVSDLQEVMDAADVENLADEIPDALSAFEESLARLQAIQETLVQPVQKPPAVPISGNVIRFPGGRI